MGLALDRLVLNSKDMKHYNVQSFGPAGCQLEKEP
jgi:hypothetical protein